MKELGTRKRNILKVIQAQMMTQPTIDYGYVGLVDWSALFSAIGMVLFILSCCRMDTHTFVCV